jgi:hypothetical protein
MEHVVFYPSAEGAPSFRRVSSLDDAVSFVEHLRNIESVTEFSVHALTAVPLAFRAYYRVEVPAGDEQLPAQAASPLVEDEAEAPAALSAEPAGLFAPSAEAAEVSAAVSMAPVEASDDDRSEEWVAEAAVVEAPVGEASVAAAPDTELGQLPVVAGAPVPNTPFAEAPPVTPPGMDAFVTDPAPTPEPVAAAAVDPETATTEVVPLLAGRRSMGFFTR